jgi:hypothetical protein
MTIDDARAYGRVGDVSANEIRAAIAADRLHTTDKIYEIEVVSSNEIHVYHEQRTDALVNYDIVKRVGDRWRFIVVTVFVG